MTAATRTTPLSNLRAERAAAYAAFTAAMAQAERLDPWSIDPRTVERRRRAQAALEACEARCIAADAALRRAGH